MRLVEIEARNNDEILRVNTNKIREVDYLNRAMKKLNAELSPFRDKEDYDEEYIRAMWTRYSNLQILRNGSTDKEIAKDLPRVAALVKTMKEGKDDKDAQTLQRWADGELDFTDKKV